MKTSLLIASLFALGGCTAKPLPEPEPPALRLGRTADAAVAAEPRPKEILESRAPAWARRRMFGHKSPAVMLVGVNGGILDGRQLVGKRRLMVYWDWGSRDEEAAAVDFLQVLQKAQEDLSAKTVEIMFVHTRFPTGRKALMTDTDLRAWQKKWTVTEGGKPRPRLNFFRFPNEVEFNAAREIGLEGPFTVYENLSLSPEIVMLDESGLVRWHSAGIEDPQDIGSKIPDPEQATIIAAIEFALTSL